MLQKPLRAEADANRASAERTQIAVIGWGSLIWCPGSLRIASRWHADGPCLPIEFARISRGDRLTLVIHPGSPEVQTYWALSAFERVGTARGNLQEREGTSSIHDVSLMKNDVACDSPFHAAIRAWTEKRERLQAAIWTGLLSNWPDKRPCPFSPVDADRYISGLSGESLRLAREYVQNTPQQIQTPVRALLREQRNFRDAVLSPILFEADAFE
jgi:hypothetical protein